MKMFDGFRHTNCYLAIRDMLDYPIEDEVKHQLLKATYDFLSKSGPSEIKPHQIEEILQEVTSALEAFKATGRKDGPYELCRFAIIERLQAIDTPKKRKALDKDDRIYIYFHTEGNATKLKELLSAAPIDDDESTTSPGQSRK